LRKTSRKRSQKFFSPSAFDGSAFAVAD
jgi:hypothetical protein